MVHFMTGHRQSFPTAASPPATKRELISRSEVPPGKASSSLTLTVGKVGTLIALKFGTTIAALGVVAPASQVDKGISMLKWAILFFVISLIAGFFGFGKVESGAKSIAKVLFVVALLIFLVVLVFGVFLGTLVF